MKIFVAYPYKFTKGGYRGALASRFSNDDVTFLYADERLVNDHVLAKIRQMMSEADTCMFDISGNNPNVMLELGIALGEKHPGFVAVDKQSVTKIGADVVGWDQLRYDSFEDLANKLHGFVTKAAVPQRDVTSISAPFDREITIDEQEYFSIFIRNGLIGHFDLLVRPVEYRPDLIPKSTIRDVMRQFHASYTTQRGLSSSAPWDTGGAKIENFSGGVSLLYDHPEWARCERARLRTSGLYRIIRIFSEDYDKDGHIQETDRTLGVTHFIEQVTLLHLLARNISRQLASLPEPQVNVTLVIDGLLNRRPVIDDYEVNSSFTIGAQAGSDRTFSWTSQFDLATLESDAVTIARERIGEVFWSFGLRPTIIEPIQRRLLGNSEPKAFSQEQ